MAAGEGTRKLLSVCGKPLGIFTERGLELYCRFCKEKETVPYQINNLRDAIEFVERRRRRGRRGSGERRI